MASFSLAYKVCTINIDKSEELAEVIESEPESSAVSPNYSAIITGIYSVSAWTWRTAAASQIVDFPPNLIDPSPFQLVEKTSLNKVAYNYNMFLTLSLTFHTSGTQSVLALSHAYVIRT